MHELGQNKALKSSLLKDDLDMVWEAKTWITCNTIFFLIFHTGDLSTVHIQIKFVLLVKPSAEKQNTLSHENIQIVVNSSTVNMHVFRKLS